MARWYVPPAVFRRLRAISSATSHVEELDLQGRPVSRHVVPAKRLHEEAVRVVQRLRDGEVTEKVTINELKGLIAQSQRLRKRVDHDAETREVKRRRRSYTERFITR